MEHVRHISRRRFSEAAGGAGLAGVAHALGGGITFAQSDATPAASPAASPAAELSFTLGVVDTLLGEVTLPENPQRVLCINDGPVDTMLNLGLVPIATGFSYGDEAGGDQAVMSYLQPLVPEGAEITYVGGWDDFDVEKAIALKPDLILAEGRERFTGATKADAEADPNVQALLRIAPLVIPKDIETEDPLGLQYFEYSHLLWSHCLGKLDEGQALLDAQREKTAQLAVDMADHEGETSIVFRPTPDFPLVMSQKWFTGVLLHRVGIVGNEYAESVPYPHSGKNLSLEQMDKLDADWIFIAPRFSAEMSADRDALVATYMENPLFAALPAIVDGQYGLVDGQVWSGANSMVAADIILDNIRNVIVDGVQDQTSA
ncbi:MAG: ABC transporter substrate-binding protein [Thermomicrobiales bacterium]